MAAGERQHSQNKKATTQCHDNNNKNNRSYDMTASINEKLLSQGACLRFADPHRNDPIIKISFLIALLFEDIDNTDRHIALPISLHFSLFQCSRDLQ